MRRAVSTLVANRCRVPRTPGSCGHSRNHTQMCTGTCSIPLLVMKYMYTSGSGPYRCRLNSQDAKYTRISASGCSLEKTRRHSRSRWQLIALKSSVIVGYNRLPPNLSCTQNDIGRAVAKRDLCNVQQSSTCAAVEVKSKKDRAVICRKSARKKKVSQIPNPQLNPCDYCCLEIPAAQLQEGTPTVGKHLHFSHGRRWRHREH